MSGRRQLRMTVVGAALVAITLSAIFEPPGTTGAIGYAVVLAVLLFLFIREMRAGAGS